MHKSKTQVQEELKKERIYGIGGCIICLICVVFLCFSTLSSNVSFSMMMKQSWFLLLFILCLFTGIVGVLLLLHRKKRLGTYEEIIRKAKEWIPQAAYTTGTITFSKEDIYMRDGNQRLFDFEGFFTSESGVRVDFNDFVDVEDSSVLPETIDVLYNRQEPTSFLLNHTKDEAENNPDGLEDEVFYMLYNKLL